MDGVRKFNQQCVNDELSKLLKETGDTLTDKYCSRFCDFLGELAIGGGNDPLEIWLGLAQALADASGSLIGGGVWSATQIHFVS